MSANVVTLYAVDWDAVTAVAVFRLINGRIEVEQLMPCPALVDEWLEGTWDAQADRMIVPMEGERYLQALVDRPMTRWRFEVGEPNSSFGWQSIEAS